MKTLLTLGAAVLLTAMYGCTMVIDPVTGKPVVSVDAASVQAISDAAVAKMNEELAKEGK